jgi:hypothetical protein
MSIKFHNTGSGNNNVGRFDVAMHHATFCRMRQTPGYLQDVLRGFRYGNPATSGDHVPEIFSFHVLESDEVQALVFTAVINAGNVFVIESGSSAGLALKTPHLIGIGCRLWRQNLQRDHAIELGVAGADHRCHATDADRFFQFEMGESATANVDGGRRTIRRTAGSGCTFPPTIFRRRWPGNDRGSIVRHGQAHGDLFPGRRLGLRMLIGCRAGSVCSGRWGNADPCRRLNRPGRISG